MKTLKSLWKSIKRNPVITAALSAAVVQIIQDYQAGVIDRAHISGYLVTLGIGIIARHFTVPVSTHKKFVNNRNEDLVKAYDRGLIDGGVE